MSETQMETESTPIELTPQERVSTKLYQLCTNCMNENNGFVEPEGLGGDVNIFDEDMMIVGEIDDGILKIVTDFVTIGFSLNLLIKNALLLHKPDVIRILLKHNVNVYLYENRIMPMCVQQDEDELMLELIRAKIPIGYDDYRAIYHLAFKGKLDLLKAIINTYHFNNTAEIIFKICTEATKCGHVHILQYFLPKEEFRALPDVFFVYFINGIKFGGHLDVVKYYLQCGVNIKTENYRSVHIAAQYGRRNILLYFKENEPDVLNVLSYNDLERLGLYELPTECKIVSEATCAISYDLIEPESEYYTCEDHKHYYKRHIWEEWIQRQSTWKCLLCFKPVLKKIYTNRKSN
jgi:hypothetical protein